MIIFQSFSELPPQWSFLHKIAEAGFDAIKKSSGRVYKFGSISSVTNRTFSGTIVDYAFGAMNIPVCLVMELPSSKYGFQPPIECIESLVTESWIGIRAMCIESLLSYKKVLYIPQKLYPTSRKNDKVNTIEISNEICNLTILPRF